MNSNDSTGMPSQPAAPAGPRIRDLPLSNPWRRAWILARVQVAVRAFFRPVPLLCTSALLGGSAAAVRFVLPDPDRPFGMFLAQTLIVVTVTFLVVSFVTVLAMFGSPLVSGRAPWGKRQPPNRGTAPSKSVP